MSRDGEFHGDEPATAEQPLAVMGTVELVVWLCCVQRSSSVDVLPSEHCRVATPAATPIW